MEVKEAVLEKPVRQFFSEVRSGITALFGPSICPIHIKQIDFIHHTDFAQG